MQISVGINDLPTSWTYLSRKSLSTTAEMSSKGFPIPNSVFSLWGDRNLLYHTDSHTPDKTNSPLSHRLSYVSNSLDSITETLMRGDHVFHQQHIEKLKRETPKQWTRTCPITVMTWEKLLFSLHCERCFFSSFKFRLEKNRSTLDHHSLHYSFTDMCLMCGIQML